MGHPDLTFQVLEQITDKFSEERKLGQGAFGTVYRGVHKNGKEIAVKMLRDKDPGLDDMQFEDEFHKLRILSHPNVVQLIGYCYETHREYIEHEGVPVLAEKIYRALCFEYLRKGSLQNHLSDECHGLDWHTRYNIIKGTCEGLKYLHMGLKNPIYHLDLKPGNILLDDNMVPKLADFGLSKILERTRSTDGIHGTLGYMPPEYVGNNIRSTKFDIFSLGVVILEIIAGPTARTRIGAMPPQEFTNQLQDNWKIRLQKAWSGSSLEAYCQQVNACIDIAMKCMEFDKDRRPHIANVVHQLNEIENEIGKSVLLSVQSVELQFHSNPSNLTISSLMRLTNNTAARVAFRLLTINSEYFLSPRGGMVPPMSSCALAVTTMSDQKALENSKGYLTLESITAVAKSVQHATLDAADSYYTFFTEAQKDGRVAQQVKLMALYVEPPLAGNSANESQIDWHAYITASRFRDYTEAKHNSKILTWMRRKARFCVNKIFFNNTKEQVGAPNGIMRSESPKQSYSKDLELLDGSPHIFTYEELEEATGGFNYSRELGDGGYGAVYKGKLRDGRIVAIKRLYKNNYKRIEQFINEVDILSRLLHQNLVILYGCTSSSSRDLMLVYEYIPNGTVADHLRGLRASERGLTWPVRMNIAIETAEALAYLHAVEIIHRDVKTNNILLDNSFHVKVADFGLSCLYPLEVTHVSTVPQGTPGYVDPVYHQCHKLTDKSDVYSFGVVLVELISSRRAVDMGRRHSEINLANMAVNRIQNHEVEQLVDPELGYETDDETKRMIDLVAELAFQCLQLERELRPSMNEVLDALNCIKNADSPEKRIEMNSPKEDAHLLKKAYSIRLTR